MYATLYIQCIQSLLKCFPEYVKAKHAITATTYSKNVYNFNELYGRHIYDGIMNRPQLNID